MSVRHGAEQKLHRLRDENQRGPRCDESSPRLHVPRGCDRRRVRRDRDSTSERPEQTAILLAPQIRLNCFATARETQKHPIQRHRNTLPHDESAGSAGRHARRPPFNLTLHVVFSHQVPQVAARPCTVAVNIGGCVSVGRRTMAVLLEQPADWLGALGSAKEARWASRTGPNAGTKGPFHR